MASTAGRTVAAAHLLFTQSYDAVILDLELPSMDGLTVLRRLRARGNTVPVMVLTAGGELSDRVAVPTTTWPSPSSLLNFKPVCMH